MPSFAYKYFDGLSAEDVIDILENNIPDYSRGSSRVVYRISKRQVIKVAINGNKPGIAQNKREVFLTKEYGHLGLFANVIWYHPNYDWIISQYAKPLLPSAEKNNLACKLRDRFDIAKKLGVEDVSPGCWFQFGTINKKVVIVDYGASKEILRKYY